MATGSKRGLGACKVCFKEYSNRKKPKFCPCGNHLGGSFTEKTVVSTADPSSVCIYEQPSGEKLLSIRVSPKGDRKFCFIGKDHKICYDNRCLQYRTSLVTSGKVSEFKCDHMTIPISTALYRIKYFELDQLAKFTNDLSLQREMSEVQMVDYPTVIKISKKSYAVIGKINAHSVKYTHVMLSIHKDGKHELLCTHADCKGKVTKQVIVLFT